MKILGLGVVILIKLPGKQIRDGRQGGDDEPDAYKIGRKDSASLASIPYLLSRQFYEDDYTETQNFQEMRCV